MPTPQFQLALTGVLEKRSHRRKWVTPGCGFPSNLSTRNLSANNLQEGSRGSASAVGAVYMVLVRLLYVPYDGQQGDPREGSSYKVGGRVIVERSWQ